MAIAIAVLVSLIISLGISIYFHSLEKNNNSLEKVRKYADKRQEDLMSLFKEIQSKFNIIMSDFNSQQTQANAAIKLLKQQNDDFISLRPSAAYDVQPDGHAAKQRSPYDSVFSGGLPGDQSQKEHEPRRHQRSFQAQSPVS